MLTTRSWLVAAACALLLPAAACGGSSDNEGDDDPVIAEGAHHGYVVGKVYVPTNKTQANEWGLDIASTKSSKPDGLVDNVLGEAFGSLAGRGFQIQPQVDEAVDEGTIMLLVDFQTADFTTSAGAGFAIKIGASSTPPACATPTDCRRHLDGNATFTLSPTSPSGAVTGTITNGTFKGGPGELSLQLAIGAQAFQVTLHNARAKATSISDTALTAVIAGAITSTELNDKIAPQITSGLNVYLDDECGTPRTPANGCGCAGKANAMTVLSLFDTSGDCTLTTPEVVASDVFTVAFDPDVCSSQSCAKPDAISIGVKVEAVKASFPL